MSDNKSSSGGVSLGYLIGAIVGAICSWSLNHSILWACFHAFVWWLYIPYLCLGCGGGFPTQLPW